MKRFFRKKFIRWILFCKQFSIKIIYCTIHWIVIKMLIIFLSLFIHIVCMQAICHIFTYKYMHAHIYMSRIKYKHRVIKSCQKKWFDSVLVIYFLMFAHFRPIFIYDQDDSRRKPVLVSQRFVTWTGRRSFERE